jgi:hypothetical protein
MEGLNFKALSWGGGSGLQLVFIEQERRRRAGRLYAEVGSWSSIFFLLWIITMDHDHL